MNTKLKKILIKTKRQVFSEIAGNNPSIFKGEGYDFIELREYMHGDDVKKIDWIISAKLQKPFVKVFREERELNIVVASMLSGSVHFGTTKFKQELIAEICSIIGFSTIKNGDLLSSYIFTDKLERFIEPSKKIFAVNKMVDVILNFDSLYKKSDFKLLAKTLKDRVKRKSIIFVVSDFFDDVDLRLLTKKHEVIAIVVRDKFEEEPTELGFVNLIDPQTKATLEGDLSKRVCDEYKKELKLHDLRLFDNFKKNKINFTKIYTTEEPFIKLTKLFSR